MKIEIGFDGSVAVQARMTLDETRWLLELAARHESIRGVVGYVEFLSPEVESQIDEFKDHPKCVGMRHVVDHISKPLIRDGVLSPWDDHIRQLARFENVSCKLSGMVTEADWRNWKPNDFETYMDVVLEAFGPNRLMIGSDWPVCLVAGSYGSVMNVVVDFVRRLSGDEQARILGGTCREVYRL